MTDNPSSYDDQTLDDSDSAEASGSVKPKRRVRRTILIALGSLVVLIGLAVGIGYFFLASQFNDIERVEIIDPNLERPEPVVTAPDELAPVNILLLGSDTRGNLNPDANAEDLRGFRSDAIMVMQISADRQDVTIMSIMRDNWVPIQGHDEAKINAAVAYGGVPLAVNTVEMFIDSRIDHVALIDFESFKGLTDAVGGVTINNPIAFTSYHGNFPFEAGKITLNGEEALGFVRERYAFSDGDYQRAKNQQIYIKGLMAKLLSKDTLTNPGKITDTFNALKPYLVVDKGLDLNTVIGLGVEMRNFKKENIIFFTSPTLGTGTSADGQSIVKPDWDKIADLREAVRAGTLDDYAEAQVAESQE